MLQRYFKIKANHKKVLDMYLAVGRVMIEYIVIGGVNDSPETAHKLGLLFVNKDVIINLIPYL
jgi:adenine C2-methylase RlmN of 23S rRNA A2503 and tRNA A37